MKDNEGRKKDTTENERKGEKQYWQSQMSSVLVEQSPIGSPCVDGMEINALQGIRCPATGKIHNRLLSISRCSIDEWKK